MQVIKEKLEIEESLKKRITNLLKFQNIKGKLVNGNIISIPKTNLAYIEPHKLELQNNTYLFFNECKEVYINTLEHYSDSIYNFFFQYLFFTCYNKEEIKKGKKEHYDFYYFTSSS